MQIVNTALARFVVFDGTLSAQMELHTSALRPYYHSEAHLSHDYWKLDPLHRERVAKAASLLLGNDFPQQEKFPSAFPINMMMLGPDCSVWTRSGLQFSLWYYFL